MTRPRLYIALPWLEDAAWDAYERRALAELPALAWLVSRGTLVGMKQDSWRHWLLEAAGHADAHHTLTLYAAGPCVARLAQLDSVTAATWASAQPVHLAAAMDHLRLASLQQAQLGTADCAELAASINAHIGDRGFTVNVFADGTWLLRSMNAIDCQSHDPALVAGHNIHDYMPSGRDGALVRSLMNEIQMVLHEHPVNESRARRNEPVVNALWLWGFGPPLQPEQPAADAPQPAAQSAADEPPSLTADTAPKRGELPSPSSLAGPSRNRTLRACALKGTEPPGMDARRPGLELGAGTPPRVMFSGGRIKLPALRDVPLLADDPWLRGIWRVYERETTPWTPRNSVADIARDSCIAVSQPPAGDTMAALLEIGGTLLAPLRSALAAGALDGIELLIGSRVLQVEASARFKFWRRASTVARLLE